MKNRFSIALIVSASDEEIAETLGVPVEEIVPEQIKRFGDEYVKLALIAEAEDRITKGKLTVMREI